MEINYEIIVKYLEGKGTDAERQKIIEWFNDLHAEKELRKNSRRYFNELHDNPEISGYNEKEILGRIYRQIKLNESVMDHKRSSKTFILSSLVKVAAVLFIPLLILFVSYNRFGDFRATRITYNEIYSPPGSRTMFSLPDGSKGWLNSGSVLKFPQRFYGKNREVKLSGEAYFDVVSNPHRPFIVSGKNIDVIARGTAFNVACWSDETVSKVTLVHGKVDIYKNTDQRSAFLASLKPDQLFTYSSANSKGHIRNVDVGEYIAWKQGKLVFRDDPFTEVVKKINRWYNVNLVIKDDRLKSYTYVATFQNESLDEVLKMLKISAPIEYKDVRRIQRKDGTFEKRTVELYYSPKK